jgi:steroid 5-alpha reductase family enzyme
MLDWGVYGASVAAMLVLAVAFWIISLVRNDVSIVDSLWSLMFLLLLGLYTAMADVDGARSAVVLVLVAIWAVRLSAFITIRNHGQPEDHRYQTIRKNNEPNFRYKSLYIVFGLQAGLAAVIAIPLVYAASGTGALGWLDFIGLALWSIGMFFEVVGDQQLRNFRSNPANRGKVLDTGLWALTRHPNYFGEFTLWWGYYCFALAAGGWWTIFAPLLMSVLLLRVSGVALLESDISERRPAYARYIETTPAFFPRLSNLGRRTTVSNGS